MYRTYLSVRRRTHSEGTVLEVGVSLLSGEDESVVRQTGNATTSIAPRRLAHDDVIGRWTSSDINFCYH